MSINFQKIHYNSKQYWQVVRLREIVLRLPLYLRFSLDNILNEKDEIIFAAISENHIIASCQFIIEGKKAKMRQVATKNALQGQGIGRDLYQYCEKELIQKKIDTIYCHARITVVPFYEKMSFQKEGDIFEEVGIPHIKMYKYIL